MLSLGPISFAAPWALAALVSLPALWWLLRMTPPTPRRIRFPSLRFLATLATREETPARTPPWLLALRLALVAAVILGAAQPVLNAQGGFSGTGPIVLIIDDGWSAARDWSRKRLGMLALVERARRVERPVIVVTTAAESAERPAPTARLLAPAEARAALETLRPKPWPTDRAAAVAALAALEGALAGGGEIFWLSDGLEEDEAPTLAELSDRLQRWGPVRVVAPEAAASALLLRPCAAVGGDDVAAEVVRADTSGTRDVAVVATSEAGVAVAREIVPLVAGAGRGEIRFRLPAEMRERVARLDIEGEQTAGSAVLVDERWRRRPVGLAAEPGEDGRDGGPPLLAPLYYVDRALAGFAEVRTGAATALLERDLAVLVVPDRARFDTDTEARIERWVEGGGTLVRFAGQQLGNQAGERTALTARGGDPLLPVGLRGADRILGGALSWQAPARLAPFDSASPFAGLTIPDEVVVHRQILAEPSFDIDQLVWARLSDGTPLITARRLGNGWLVLFHVTANAEWSNLPLSGLFVEMLERLVRLGRAAGTAAVGSDGPPLAPVATLDGAGVLSTPPPGARAIEAGAFADAVVSPRHPPGFYGNDAGRAALNLGATIASLRPLSPMPPGVAVSAYRESGEHDLRGWLLGAALALALLDLVLGMVLRGLVRWPRRGRRAAVPLVALVVALALPAAGSAAERKIEPGEHQGIIADGSAAPAAITTRLAYVATGERATDAVSQSGLDALSTMVNRRTAAELGPAVGVTPGIDELAFYPLLYWPLVDGTAPLSAVAARPLVDYMRNGGTIVFDTRDAGVERTPALRDLARVLELPPLVPVPANHVLRRAYYLLADLPGRRTGDTVWVVDGAEGVNDGVTPVIAGSNDWAGAWAADDALRPMFPVVPGGEQQREMAYRFGINLVMHVLTGNYKADQVHLPAIMQRLGQ